MDGWMNELTPHLSLLLTKKSKNIVVDNYLKKMIKTQNVIDQYKIKKKPSCVHYYNMILKYRNNTS